MALSHTYSRRKDNKGRNTDKVTYDYYDAGSITHDDFLNDNLTAETRVDIDFDNFTFGDHKNSDVSYNPGKDRLFDFGAGNDDVNYRVRKGDSNRANDWKDKNVLAFLGSGNDIFKVSNGSQNSSKFAHIFGGSGNDTIISESRAIHAYGGDNNDTLIGGDGKDSLWGEDGNDYLSGGTDADVLVGGIGDDTLYGGRGEDILSGGEDNDIIDGGRGKDTIYGGEGNDVINPGRRDIGAVEEIYSGSGRDIIFSGHLEGNLEESGISLRDLASSYITPERLVDVGSKVFGKAAPIAKVAINATIGLLQMSSKKSGDLADSYAEHQNDYTHVMDFDPTQDIMVVNSSVPGDNENPFTLEKVSDGGESVIEISRDAGGTLARLSIDEALVKRIEEDTGEGGSAVRDQLIEQTISHTTKAWKDHKGSLDVIAMESNEFSSYEDYADTIKTGISLENNEAILTLGATSQIIDASLYDDFSGSKIVVGQQDVDNLLIAKDMRNKTWANLAANTSLFMVGGNESDTFHLSGNRGAKKIVGDDGNDTIMLTDAVFYSSSEPTGYVVDLSTTEAQGIRKSGAKGYDEDTLEVFGIENIVASQYDDELTGDSAANKLLGGDGNDILDGGSGNDHLEGGAGDDVISGGRDNDVLYGGEGNDNLDGHNGADRLHGGQGDDTLHGGSSKETFVFEGTDFGNDIITDFGYLHSGDRTNYGAEKIKFTKRTGTDSAGNDFVVRPLFSSFSQMMSSTSDDSNGDAVIRSGNSSVTLQGVSKSELTAASFEFEEGYDIGHIAGSTWNLIGAGDFNGDGTDDVLLQHQGGQAHVWGVQNGQRVSGYHIGHIAGSAWNLIGAGDFNGDGTDDMLFQHQGGQVHTWGVQNGQRVSGDHIHTPVHSNWTLVGAGDFNGDGTDDLLWQHQDGQVHAWEMQNGQRVRGYHIQTPVHSNWSLIDAGDFNGDGTDDILWQHQNGRIHVWEMQNGQRVSGFDINRPLGSGQTLIGGGDFNQDGTSDILIQQSNGQASVWDGMSF